MAQYIVPAVIIVLVVAGVLIYRAGKKGERGKQHDSHMEGDDAFHDRGEEWDAANPLCAPGLPESDDQ